MRTDAGVKREQLSAWQVESLRLTAFAHGKVDISNARWLEELFGDDVVRIQDNRASGVRSEIVSFAKGKLLLQTIPQVRVIHWTFETLEGAEFGLRELNLVDSLEPFRELMERWLHSCPDLQRIAFGCVLRLPVSDRESGYRKMSDYLVFNIDEDSYDFSYQINRPRMSSVFGDTRESIRINRLSRWSIAASFVIGILPVQVPPTEISSHCRIELDINTEAEFQEVLPRSFFCSLFDEIVRLGCELVTEGDIK